MLIMADVDRFKSINDTHGHEGGDAVLIDTAARIRENLRKIDVAARWGGEEFLVLLPGTELETKHTVAEKLRTVVASNVVIHDGARLSVTMTLGVSVCAPGCDPEAAVREADGALFRGKQRGRNREVLHRLAD